MTKSPNEDHHSNSSAHKPLWCMALSRGGIALSGLLLVGIAGGIWRLRSFVQQELTPLAQSGITNTLNRPVNLGEVTGFSLTGVKFGASTIPATPTDSDRAVVDAVEVGFNPWQLIFQRQLKLDVTLINPDIYIEQDNQGRWITTEIAPPGKPSLIKTDLDKLRFRNGKLVLMAQVTDKTPVAFSQVNGTAQLLEKNQLVKFDVRGEADSEGSIAIQGELVPKTLAAKLQLRSQDLLAAKITDLIKLPFDLQAGRVNGNLQIQLRPEQPTLLFGNADLQGVTLQIPNVPQAFLNTQGAIRFQGTEVQLDNIVGSYGKIPLVATGIIDPQTGYKLAGRVNGVSVANTLETLKIKAPVPVNGELQANLQMLGPITKPILSGTIGTIKTAQIDKINFNNITTKFEFAPNADLISFRDIQGKAAVGGEITGVGKINLGTTPQLDFNFAAKNISGDAVAKLYETTPPIQIGTVSATAQLTGIANNVQTIVRWQAPEATYAGTGETAIAADRTLAFRNVALNVGGGMVRGSGSFAKGRWQAVAQASGVGLTPFVDQNQLQNISLAGAEFNGRVILEGSAEPFKIATIRTEGAGVNIGGGTVAVSRVDLQNQNFSAQLVANNVRLGRILKESPPALDNPLAGTFQIAGNTENLGLNTLRGTGEARLNLAGGTVTASNIQLANGLYQAQVQANNLAIQQLAAVPEQFKGALTGQFKVAGSVESFSPEALQATGQGRLNVAGGAITASNIQLANGRYQAQVQTNNLPLQQLVAVPPQFRGGLTGQLNVAGSVESFSPETIQASGQGRLNVAGGTITASNIQLANGRYQAVVDAAGVELNRFNQQLRGDLGGKLQVAGILGSAKLADVRAAGQVQLSQGIPGLEQPLIAALTWTGEKIAIEQAIATGLNISGDILTNAKTAAIPEITQLNLNVQAQNYNLQQLPINLPNQFAVAGNVDFDGQITGNLPLPNVTGKIGLRDLVVQDIAFEPLLTGNIRSATNQGLNLDLRGNRDRIALNLDAQNRPQSFLVQRQEAFATGQAQGDDLAIKVANFPLQILNLTPPPDLRLGGGTVAGSLTGDVLVNQQTLAATGNLAIASPEIGRITGDRLAAEFRYSDGQATLTSSEFVKGDSRYAFAGNFGQTPQGPQLQGKLNINQGNIQDVLTVAQIFELQDFQRGAEPPTYGTATDLVTQPRGLPEQPLLTQLKRFYEIDAQLEAQEQQRRESNPIPDLADLQGTFNGEIAVDTATANGLSVQFNLNGQNFTWGQETETNRFYTANNILAQGRFENGILQLRPLRIELENSRLTFAGNIGGDDQSGQLRVSNFPIELLSNFVNLPVGISGNLNGTAAIAGSIANPQSKGQLEITEGTLNQQPVELAKASFSYANGRFNFGSIVSVVETEPVNITGNIPYQLPFASVAPENNEITLDIKVQNEGLAILNLLTNQVTFEKGEGDVDIQVRGTSEKPIVNGIATLNNATFTAQALPEKIRRVTGKVLFDFDRILVENLEGRFSRGNVVASGEIPIFNNGPANQENPLTVNVDELALNLKGLYQGGASGNLQITGSALNPEIGGQVNLFDGQVLLANTANPEQPVNSNGLSSSVRDATRTTANKQIQPDGGDANVMFNNLDIELGKNVEVNNPPILSFRATGNLTVNGSFAEPIPDGTINLEAGGVNLFTTQFNLARGYKHTATFRANQPRDPELDVRLIAKVLDVVQSSDFTRANTAGLAALESVQVEANVQGFASQINETLELTSSPSRSETEIVALLGGGFADGQGGGDSTLGLINIAGSAVFSNFQSAFSQIGSAVGLSELRIFPTIVSNNPEAGRSSSSSLELAAEAGIDVSPKVSLSSIKILTANDPFQWGVNYRINDEIRLRASTNLDDDSRAVVEFQRRF
ncbi:MULTISPECIES: translocation/assembly module TamB [unclassified Nodularia (in: cyanobacteria)]|uniref:translocation/assembly module TamB n=1 Tax=unclassified Nodularia (in: cyanobacteria) TaxID=2656917 RepID=UPI0018821399|nr:MULTISPECIES: translocation/assembly module TamB [unclassified Nodularia (in: cyanobacteria)]MBE9199764.1 translocation/assembly module TamB domain-containing protein [Nodularia sp. LEGE 06071]MCC2693334.1 translocation/assembly module TamB domain-containing protein [Nodularia sp. LEGE 04288]